MVQPVVVPRAEHTLSRRLIDADALKVLYRLKEGGFTACLVGGSVRDLLLGRRPKDFDIGTSAHPYQVKRLFRNCWIIGRRFRLAHVKFGTKVIEVATFRRQVPEPDDGNDGPGDIVGPSAGVAALGDPTLALPPAELPGEPTPAGAAPAGTDPQDLLIKRDNTFGTPEEDAFRRDFTVNALFYDIANFSIIDYVGGLRDLKAGVVRAIGDPVIRFREDPVRMLRAVALAGRLGFTIDGASEAALGRCRADIARSAPARLLEEYYKILRAGASEATFRRLVEIGLLEPVCPALHEAAGDPLWRSLGELDRYRRGFDAFPGTLTNAILLGSLLVPLGWTGGPDASGTGAEAPLGMLPIPRRERERLRQVFLVRRKLQSPRLPPRVVRSLVGRLSFAEALTWMEIHDPDPDLVTRWRECQDEGAPAGPPAEAPKRRPRRRRRRPRRPAPPD